LGRRHQQERRGRVRRRFRLTQYYNDAAGEWQDITSEGFSIVGYFYPISKEGNLVEMTVESLQESLGWSGASLAELNDTDWSQTEVQLVLQSRTTTVDYAGGSASRPTRRR
jgi:hypothetical protein